MENDQPHGLSRRTVAKGAAWAVPAVVALGAAPKAAASVIIPPTPVINFAGACGNTGATQKGCGGTKTLQVPLTLTNNTGHDLVFQVVGMWTANSGTAPTGPGNGIYTGIRGVWGRTGGANNNCVTNPARGKCSGGLANGSILVPTGTNNATYWIESAQTGDSSSFATTIKWQIVDASTCGVLLADQAQTSTAISPQNC